MLRIYYGRSDIAPIVTHAEVFGHAETPVRELNLTVKNTFDGRKQAVSFEKGQRIILENDDERLFIGIIFSTSIDDKGSMNIKAFDENIYLLKSVDSRKFTNVKASDIVKRLCSDFGISVGTIVDTGYVIPKLIMRDKTLWDMILTALTITKDRTGRRYFVSDKDGKLTLQSFTEQRSKWIIEVGTNLLTANYSESIEDTKTRVKVFGGKDRSIVITKSNGALEKKFGIMQEVDVLDEDSTKSQVEQRANELLKERAVIDDQAEVTALGINEVITGTAVYVREPMTKIIGGYYVSSDTHSFSNGNHTMSLTLSATYDLPPIEIDEEALTDE